ncbi:MAG: DUF115 domain-containing protein [Treponema sp.]|nr:DUF115 domain-containing protein [Treponema sp.]
MMTNSIYSSFMEAKTGEMIPVLQNGKTLESRYNPVNEAQKKLSMIDLSSNFFIVVGVASGILIKELLQLKPKAKCIAIETNNSDLEFLKSSLIIQELWNKVIFCTQENLIQTILNNYIPSIYGKCQIIEQHTWISENPENSVKIKTLISKSLEYVSKDFSVQAHFGKLWQDNIIKNLQTLEKNGKQITINIPLEKEAVIVAAGPSLDSTIKIIKENRNKYYVIATDTAFSSLHNHNIISDCVFSIDAQQISYNHFIHNLSEYKNTLFVFDLTGNHSIAHKLISNGFNVYFSVNQHPLSLYINSKSNNLFPQIQSGGGTVTVAAFDFAVNCGFNKLKVLGADFSYINNKPYANGTYLDNIYSNNANKLSSVEKSFSNLMYRIPVEYLSDNRITTSVLKTYETSFLEYLQSYNAIYSKENNIYNVSIPVNKNKIIFKSQKNCVINELIKDFSANNTDFSIKNDINLLKNTDICLLPLISWIRKHENIVEDNFSEFLKNAYSIILRSFSL